MSASLKAKIAALRAKTTANGCTEAEAGSAAEAAARLMRDHGLTEAELVMSEAASPEPTVRSTWRTPLTQAIAWCTNTKAILLIDRRGGSCLFIGRAPGPEIAVYLRDVCFRAVAGELRIFKDGAWYRRRRTVKTKRAAAADFCDALAKRLVDRLITLFRPMTDRALVAEASAAVTARFPEAERVKHHQRKARFDNAAVEGWIAGGRVPLSHGVTAPQPRQLGLFGEA